MTKRIANKLSIEQAKAKATNVLIHKGHSMRPDMNTYIAYNSPITVRCNLCGDERIINFDNLCFRGCECKCFKEQKKKQNKLKQLINNVRKKIQNNTEKFNNKINYRQKWDGNNYGDKIREATPNLIPFIDTFIDGYTPMKMYCLHCNKVIDKRVGDAIRGFNCNNCYGVGFKKERKAILYILKIYLDSDKDVHLGYKVGITNKTAKERCNAINKKSQLHCEVIYEYESDGSKIAEIEKLLLKNIPTGFIDKCIFEDGSTETFNTIYLMPIVELLLVIS